MDVVTLLHSRFPKDEFIYNASKGENIDDVDDLSADERAALYRSKGRPITKAANVKRISGLWGTMMMIVGGPITSVNFDRPAMGPLLPGERREVVKLNNRDTHLVIKGDIKSAKQFTTIERYRTDTGTVNQWDLGYVRLVGRDQPYGLRVETGNSVVKTLRTGHDGACIRVLGGQTAQQRSILIHEAPHVGWVIGCIGPRPYRNREAYHNKPGNPSDLTIREIIAVMRRHGSSGTLFEIRS